MPWCAAPPPRELRRKFLALGRTSPSAAAHLPPRLVIAARAVNPTPLHTNRPTLPSIVLLHSLILSVPAGRMRDRKTKSPARSPHKASRRKSEELLSLPLSLPMFFNGGSILHGVQDKITIDVNDTPTRSASSVAHQSNLSDCPSPTSPTSLLFPVVAPPAGSHRRSRMHRQHIREVLGNLQRLKDEWIEQERPPDFHVVNITRPPPDCNVVTIAPPRTVLDTLIRSSADKGITTSTLPLAPQQK
jgi:hypothetical protein